MTKEEKVLVIQELKELLQDAKVVYVASLEGMNAAATSDFRRQAFKSNVTLRVVKNTLLQTNELGAVVTEKGKDLEFTAVYRKLFNVEFEKTLVGSITLSKETEDMLKVDEFNSIGDATRNNKIIVVPRAGYSLSYFVVDKNVKVNVGNGTKEIFAGQRIEEKDLYNIVPTTNLKITPIFKWTLSSGKLEDMIDEL